MECGNADPPAAYFADPGVKKGLDLANCGYPIRRKYRPDGQAAVITKLPDTGRLRQALATVKRAIASTEVHDPRRPYLTPDGHCGFQARSTSKAVVPDRVPSVEGRRRHARVS